MNFFFCFSVGILFRVDAFAQDSAIIASNFPPPVTAQVVYAVETKVSITVDGKLLEGGLKGLKLPPPSVNIRVQPYTLYQFGKSTNTGDLTNTKSVFKAGGEIKQAVNPRSVLDITFNTDFAQADVDLAVNNLTRFNVFFPERRQFFLEKRGEYAGADFTDSKLFFSRTIGLANTQFNAGPVSIDAGTRYSDRNQKRTRVGLYVHQRETNFQGSTNFGVARYLRNYGKQNNIGVMLI